MADFLIDAKGKYVFKNDHVHHAARTDQVKYEDRRGIVVAIDTLHKEATVWFYDTRNSEPVSWNDLTRPVY